MAETVESLDFLKNPLFMLSVVASNTLLNERETLSSCSKTSTRIKKPPKKRHASSEPVSYSDIKAMSKRARMEKFSELLCDEMNKKYTCKCLFSPRSCEEIFKSFGNEKKAVDQMEKHLNSHMIEMKRNFEKLDKTPSVTESFSNSVQRSPKKSKLIQSEEFLSLPIDLEYQKHLKRSGGSTCSAKKMLEFNNSEEEIEDELENEFEQSHATKGIYSERKKSAFNSCLEESLFGEQYSYHDCFGEEVSSEEKYDQSSIESDDSTDYNANDSDDASLTNTDVMTPDNSCSWELDHSYASINGVKVEKPSYDTRRVKKKKIKRVKPQFIIKTPPVPFVFIPVTFELAQIIELDAASRPVDMFEIEVLDYRIKEDTFPSRNTRKFRKEGCSKRVPHFCHQDVTGSVLECVENRVDIKSSSSFLYKSTFHDNDNQVENMENLQRVKKDLALKLISQLQTQHKKKKKEQPLDPLVCIICQDKSFTALATLIHHYRSHAGIKPYACNICDSTFTRQHSLNYHMLIHQNRSRFTCEYCQRAFRHPSHYREHLRRHTGEAPYRCNDCNLQFKTRNTFKRHLKLRHKKLLTAQGIADVPDSCSDA